MEGVPRVVAMHVNAIPIQFRPQFPLTHMPFQQAAPQMPQQQQNTEQVHHHHAMPEFRFAAPQQHQFQAVRQIPLPLQPLIRQMQQAHMNEFQQRQEQPEVRIQLQRIAVPIPAESHEIHQQQEQPQVQIQQQIQPQVQVQRIPLAVALQRAGITAEDLKNIQHMAEQRIQQELRELAAEEDESSSSEEDDSQEENRPHPLAYGRMAFGRSLAQPINLPGPMQVVEEQAENGAVPAAAASENVEEPERPHCKFVC